MRFALRSVALLATAAITTLLPVAGPTAAAEPLPARHALAVFRHGPVTGIVALITDASGDGLAYIGGDGFGSDVHPTYLSHQRCGVPHDPATGQRSLGRLGTSAGWVVARRRVAGLLPFIEQDARFSVRVFRITASGRREVACANAVRFGDAGDRVAAARGQTSMGDVVVMFTSRGVVLLRPMADGVRITASLPGLPAATHRIVGDDAPCGTPMTGTPPMVWTGNPGAGLLGVTAPTTGDPLSIASVRLFKGASGTGNPQACSGLRAILAPR